MTTIETTRIDLMASRGAQTLVGFVRNSDPPYDSGNCCDIANMYAENVREFADAFPEIAKDCEVYKLSEHTPWRNHGYYVIDERVPKEWLNNKHDCRRVMEALREAGKIQ